jgi:hypothetical protein
MSATADLAPLFARFDACLDRPAELKAGILADLSPTLVAYALKAGWFAAGDILSEWTCTACDEPHTCNVDRTSDGAYSYRCLHNPCMPLDRQDLQTYLPDWRAFTESLAASIGSDPRGIAAHGNGRLLKLGYLAPADRLDGWTLGLTRRLEDPSVLLEMLDALRTTFPKGPGLIAVVRDHPLGARRINDYRFVDIALLFRVLDGRLILDCEAAERFLDEGERPKRKTGRRSATAYVATLRQTLIEEEAWPKTQATQIKAIIKRWCPEIMGKTPSPSSLPRNLREVEKAEREGRPIT